MPIKIGFIGSSAPSSPHHDSFRQFIPKDLEFTFVQNPARKLPSTTPVAKSTR